MNKQVVVGGVLGVMGSIAGGPAWALPTSGATWTVLSGGDPYIECTEEAGEPWCRSTGLVALPVDKVADTLEHMAQHQALFESIVKIEVLEPDVMHIVLDFPVIMSDRDYVARYTPLTEGETRIYRWEPVTHAKAPETSDAVRLPKMAGEWRLSPKDGQTLVTYVWHAQIAGSFPEAMLGTARTKAGQQALADIRKAAKAANP
jgi:hypothetical protein